MSELVVRRLAGATPGTVIALQRHLLGLSGRERPSSQPVLIFAHGRETSALLGRYQTYGPGRSDPPPPHVFRRLSGGRATAMGPMYWLWR